MNSVKKEALRYLGVKNIPDYNTVLLVDECIEEINKYALKHFTKQSFLLTDNILENGLKLEGENIKKHLLSSKKIVMFAATLGAPIDVLIKKYQISDMTKASVFNACASALLEEYCDEINGEITKEAKLAGFYTTSRFSPGYGDFPISTQKDIISVLSGNKIGITVLPSFMLLPTKTVTAVIGLVEYKPCESNKCEVCTSKNNCIYKNEV